MEQFLDKIVRLSLAGKLIVSAHRFYQEDHAMTGKTTKMIHANDYAAEVEIDLIDDDDAWGPYLSMPDVKKLERVRKLMKNGQFAEAAREAKVIELVPFSAASRPDVAAANTPPGFGEEKQKNFS